MTSYHVDWVGAISAGAVAAAVFFLIKMVFPRLAGAKFYVVLGFLIAAFSLVVRELLRHIGI